MGGLDSARENCQGPAEIEAAIWCNRQFSGNSHGFLNKNSHFAMEAPSPWSDVLEK